MDIEAAGAKLYFSKRDAATYFDVLQVPADIQPWLAQPAIAVHKLRQVGGWSPKELELLVVGLDGKQLKPNLVYPCHSVWPMGSSRPVR